MDVYRTLPNFKFLPGLEVFCHVEFRIIGTLVLAGFGIYWVFSVFYLAVLHPLAKFPGPKLAAVSGWWLVYHEWFLGKSLTDILFELHKNHGTVGC